MPSLRTAPGGGGAPSVVGEVQPSKPTEVLTGCGIVGMGVSAAFIIAYGSEPCHL